MFLLLNPSNPPGPLHPTGENLVERAYFLPFLNSRVIPTRLELQGHDEPNHKEQVNSSASHL